MNGVKPEPRSESDILIETDVCPRCGHADRDHIYNRCRPGCGCFLAGSDGKRAAALWNAFMGRS